MGESLDVRYSVCLMAWTRSSSAAASMNSITWPNDWYGWWSRMSRPRRATHGAPGWAKAATAVGANGGSRRSANPGTACNWNRPVRSSIPGTGYTSAASRSRAVVRNCTSSAGAPASTSMRVAWPPPPGLHLGLDLEQQVVGLVVDLVLGRRGVTRKATAPVTSVPGNRSARLARMTSSSGRKAY